jgi:N-acetyl-alpha-D-glucosaminyl L-malate synthase BshA
LARIFKDLDALTTVSNSYSEMAQRVFRLSLAPEVIPNFVPFPRRDPKQLHVKAQQRMETCALQRRGQRKRPTIAHVSNFRPIKDLQGVIDIFLGIRKSLDAELWLIGDGPEMDRTQSVLHRKAPRNAVRYWGLQHDVTPILLQSDLLLMSSRAESFGLSALEAMACGVPVVAPHVGGLPEVVEHEKTGFLFPVSSSSLAVDFAVALLQDPKAHASMRRAARKRARSFSQQAMVSRYEDLYAKTLRRQRPGFMSRDAASLPRVHEMP